MEQMGGGGPRAGARVGVSLRGGRGGTPHGKTGGRGQLIPSPRIRRNKRKTYRPKCTRLDSIVKEKGLIGVLMARR